MIRTITLDRGDAICAMADLTLAASALDDLLGHVTGEKVLDGERLSQVIGQARQARLFARSSAALLRSSVDAEEKTHAGEEVVK